MQKRRKNPVDHLRRRRHLQDAGIGAAQQLGSLCERTNGPEDGAAIAEQALTLAGEDQPAANTIEQPDPKLGFQVSDLARECRLRDAQAKRCLRDGPLLGDGDKCSKVAQIHAGSLCRFGIKLQTNNILDRRSPRADPARSWRITRPTTEHMMAKAIPSTLAAIGAVALWSSVAPAFAEDRDDAQLEKARSIGAKTPREGDYIDALFVLYADHDKLTYAQRVQKYLKAMEALAQRYPNDDEAQIAYAITLNVAASANDKTYANQLKGAAILEPIFKRQPRHPGVAHYLIHLYD